MGGITFFADIDPETLPSGLMLFAIADSMALDALPLPSIGFCSLKKWKDFLAFRAFLAPCRVVAVTHFYVEKYIWNLGTPTLHTYSCSRWHLGILLASRRCTRPVSTSARCAAEKLCQIFTSVLTV